MSYTEVTIEFNPVNPWREIAITIMDQKGFDGFVETKTALLSYIETDSFTEELLSEVMELEGAESWSSKILEDQNWNATWEEAFDPVYVEDKLAILAPFHVQSFDGMIVKIQPQMSFGTGHHQTTWMMAKQMFQEDLKGKKILDMGTGTGVLAIVAEKLGADDIFAVDNDKWSYENAISNLELNECKNIKVELGDDKAIEGMTFDMIFANINKNILIEHFSVYSEGLTNGGKLFISGFFSTDSDDLIQEAKTHNLNYTSRLEKDEWALLEFQKGDVQQRT